MDARTSIKGRLPTRHLTEGGPTNAALHLPAIARQRDIRFDAVEIFKRTPCVADLKPRGRYVAKDIGEIAKIPLPPQTLFGFDADVRTFNVKLTDAEHG